MRPKFNSLVFDTVDTQKKFDEWKDFAASFEHGSDTATLPIVNVSRRMPDGSVKRFGYYQVFNSPIVFPCFHPKHTTPRDFCDMVEAFSNAQCLSSMSPQFPNGISHVGLDTHGLAVGRSNVDRLGYVNLNVEIHRRIP